MSEPGRAWPTISLKSGRRGSASIVTLLALLAGLVAASAVAQESEPGSSGTRVDAASPQTGAPEAPATAEDADREARARSAILRSQRSQTAAALDDLNGSIAASQADVAKLEAQIAEIESDRQRIQTELRAATEAQRRASRRVAAVEDRITALSEREGRLKASLFERRDVLAEVLGALERLGRTPPPALLVRPRDALGAVRSAKLMGGIIPALRDEADRLVADLDSLAEIRSRIDAEKDRYASELERQRLEEERLSRLFAAKAETMEETRSRRDEASRRADSLAERATDLQDLIASLEADTERVEAAEAAARRIEEGIAAARELADRRSVEIRNQRIAERERQRLADETTEEVVVASLPDDAGADGSGGEGDESSADDAESAAADYDLATLRENATRLAPDAAFSTLRNRLSLPVVGRLVRSFGEEDDIGRKTTGQSFAARPGAVVTSPADAKVMYSGPFRSYGQVLILDAGDGYHLVMAGMDRIETERGQFVSAGEPVAVMGGRRIASVAEAEFGASEPVLYVEFRENGQPVDPSPWWAENPSGRTRNDS